MAAIFNNLPTSLFGAEGINTLRGAVAFPFTPAGSGTLTLITIALEKIGWPMTFDAEIWSGASVPTTKLGAFTESALVNATKANVELSGPTFTALVGGTKYWIVLKELAAGGPYGLVCIKSSAPDSAGGASVGKIFYYAAETWNESNAVPSVKIETA